MRADDPHSLRVPARAEHLHTLRVRVRECAAAQGFAGPVVEDLVLAVNEACMNVIQHGYRGAAGVIELTVVAARDSIEFRVRDDAPRTDLAAWRPRALEELRPGGLGVHFIRGIMDEIAYLPLAEARGNLLCMKKYRRDRGDAR